MAIIWTNHIRAATTNSPQLTFGCLMTILSWKRLQKSCLRHLLEGTTAALTLSHMFTFQELGNQVAEA